MPADTPMVLVPRRATLEMLAAGVEAVNAGGGLVDVWPAMLSASPAREGDLGSSASPIPTEGLSGGKDDWPTDSYRAVALGLCKTVEGLITGLPDLLETGDLKDEEGLIDEAFRTLDAAAFRLAQLDLEAEEPAPSPGEGDAPVAWRGPGEVPDAPSGGYAYKVVAVKRAHSGKVYSFGAFYLNAMSLWFDEDNEERPVTGWNADREGDDTVLYDPLLSAGDELMGWCDFPSFTRPTPATPEGLRDIREALDLALARLGALEPNDSRAVSDEYVAMAAAGTPHHNDEGRAIIRRALSALQPQAQPEPCGVPPEGWFCTRQRGHDGPCAAWPASGRAEK